MHVEVAVIDFPEPHASAEFSAHLSHGSREIHWRLSGPGALHRNQYHMAWFCLSDRVSSGEPSLIATRRITEPGSREGFTDAANAALRAEILPVVARRGFGDWWSELHRASAEVDESGVIRHHLEAVRWYTERQELSELYAAGLCTVVPCNPDDRRAVRGFAHRGRTSELASAELLVNGDHAGWLMADGSLFPFDCRL